MNFELMLFTMFLPPIPKPYVDTFPNAPPTLHCLSHLTLMLPDVTIFLI